MRAHLVLVDHVERRAELLAQGRDRDTADAEDAVLVARRATVGQTFAARAFASSGTRAHDEAGVGSAGRRTRVGPIGGSFGATPSGQAGRRSATAGDSRAGQSLKSRARAHAGPRARASHASTRQAHAHVPFSCSAGSRDDRAVDVEVGDHWSPSTATAVKVSPAGMYCGDAHGPIAQHDVREPAELIAERVGRDRRRPRAAAWPA